MRHISKIIPTLLIAGGSAMLMSTNFASTELITAGAAAPKTNSVDPAKTGAPGENNCTQCHSGSVQSGTGVNTLTFSGGSQYDLSTTYTFNLDITGASSKNGFQIVALDGSNQQAGTWTVTDATNTATQSLSGKSYLNHSGPGTAQSSWSFDWNSPASDLGDVTFYLATNITNSNNSNTGDVVYLSQLTIASNTSTGISYLGRLQESLQVIDLGHTLDLSLNLEEAGHVKVSAFDASGRQLLSEDHGTIGAGQHRFNTPVQVSGLVILNVFVDNHILYTKVIRP